MNSSFANMEGLELPLVVVVGRSVRKISYLLKISAGSLIELDRRRGDMADLVVRGVVVARGEVVAISGAYGIRIQEVISHTDRLALLAAGNAFAPSRRPAAASRVQSRPPAAVERQLHD